MRVRPWHGAAAAAETLAIAVALAALVGAAGYGLQRVALRQSTPGELTAARAVGVLLRYRYLTSEIHVAGEPPRTARCLQGWQPGTRRGPAGRGARIVFSDGEQLLLGDRRVARVVNGPRPSPLPPIAEVELAGCARPLTNHLAASLLGGHRTHAVAASFDGRPALRLRVRTERTRFELFVAPRTLLPLGLHLRARGVVAWSRVRPVPLTPALRREFLRSFDG